MDAPRGVPRGFLPTRALAQHVGHRQHVAVLGVHHDEAPAAGVHLLDHGLQVALGRLLDREVDGEADVRARVARHVVVAVDPQRAAERVAQRAHVAVDRAQLAVQRELDARLAGVLEAHLAHQLAREALRGVRAHQLRLHADAVDVQRAQLLDLRLVHVLREHHEAALGILPEHLEDRLRRLAEHGRERDRRVAERVALGDRGRVLLRGLLGLVPSALVDVRRVAVQPVADQAHRQRPAAPVEHLAPLRDLLALAGATSRGCVELRRRGDLQLRDANERERERDRGACERDAAPRPDPEALRRVGGFSGHGAWIPSATSPVPWRPAWRWPRVRAIGRPARRRVTRTPWRPAQRPRRPAASA